MKAVGIIPARLAATRFPNKPMARICGMPMVGHCYHRTRLSTGIEAAYVATCDQEISKYVESIGGVAIATADTHTRATTRTAEAVKHIEASAGEQIDIVVMVQGDEPLTQPETIAETLKHFTDPAVSIVNIMGRLGSREQFLDKNNVKVVVDHNQDALYFSREPIPSPWKGVEGVLMYVQTGVIAFRRDALIHFNTLPETMLEQAESVDMNRVLEHGGKIRMVLTEAQALSVDTPGELDLAERVMAEDPTLAQYLNA
jgi:3-deoxy-manno-octulosonate cytidylyltransferase (CMP-KDO synthetase)